MHSGLLTLEAAMPTPAPRSWFRDRPRLPPEAIFLAAVMGLALGLWLAVAPPRPAVTASIAPVCADSSAQPCKRVR